MHAVSATAGFMGDETTSRLSITTKKTFQLDRHKLVPRD